MNLVSSERSDVGRGNVAVGYILVVAWVGFEVGGWRHHRKTGGVERGDGIVGNGFAGTERTSGGHGAVSGGRRKRANREVGAYSEVSCGGRDVGLGMDRHAGREKTRLGGDGDLTSWARSLAGFCSKQALPECEALDGDPSHRWRTARTGRLEP